ncbi:MULTISPECIES: HAD family hydrolase [unclassified Coleofasciculus]|uniref:HAD family hydrolase n=1 Tax=unclassified Coleofasciculus TaxID=2692782 RepID=UPI001880404D|nr:MULTISPECIES: HAD family phosphatase [unclassified Coleofasciculus]MBE9125654.1 HAD family phosphatase [Coleofasciculus sp. LEGE 07081]MBE9148808.1 HAD family phosphatase [Coleofasciculus sp. LEGE 07092]
MTLKAVLFDFNGVIINDEALHQQLVEEILIEENLRPSSQDYREICLGRSDRICLRELLQSRGRVVDDNYLTRLITRKAEAYCRQLEALPKLPIYPGLEDLIFKIRIAQLPMGVVSGALRSEIELVLNRSQLLQHFPVIVAGDDITVSKPEPDGYLLAVERLNQHYLELNARSSDCLAIEDTPAGIEAAKRAGMQVVGVANTYPFHMLQRQANWTVDYLHELELDRVQQVYIRASSKAS